MLLEIRDTKKNSFKIDVKPSDKIVRVKETVTSIIDILSVGDQTLVYNGNVLFDDLTVEELQLNKNDYVNLIYDSKKNDKVCKILKKVRSELNLKESESGGDGSEELISDVNPTIDAADSSIEDLSPFALIESPDVTKLCELIGKNPDALPRLLAKLSGQGSFVFETILENRQAFIDLLNIDKHGSVNNGIKMLQTKDHEAIDRLMKNGYEKEMTLQVYEACDFNEADAAELLNNLHGKDN